MTCTATYNFLSIFLIIINKQLWQDHLIKSCIYKTGGEWALCDEVVQVFVVSLDSILLLFHSILYLTRLFFF